MAKQGRRIKMPKGKGSARVSSIAMRASQESPRGTNRPERVDVPQAETAPCSSEHPILSTLRREQQHLLDELARQELLIQDRPATASHMADDASDVAEETTNLALRRHLEGLLQNIERALRRVERGTYGLCERCGQPIDAERLRVIPSTSLCIECAKARVHSGPVTGQATR